MPVYEDLKRTDLKDLKGYQLVVIRDQDMENIRLWRNEQIEVLRQKKAISKEEQESYFKEVIEPTFRMEEPKQILFSFLYQQACIGYGGFTNVDWEARRAEVSFLVDSKRAQNPMLYEHDYKHFLFLLCKAAFKEIKLHRLFTETFAFRQAHTKILEDFGFKYEGTLRDHVYKRGRWYDSVMHGLLAGEFDHAQ